MAESGAGLRGGGVLGDEASGGPGARAATLAGLGGAVLAAVLVCWPPGVGTLRWGGVVVRAVLYLVGCVGLGAVGVWMAVGPDRKVARALVGRVAACWLFVPGVALLVREGSLLALCLAAATGVLVSLALREEIVVAGDGLGAGGSGALASFEPPTDLEPGAGLQAGLGPRAGGGLLFREEVRGGLVPWSALNASLLLYGTGLAVYGGWLLPAVGLIAAAAVVLTWQAVEPGADGFGTNGRAGAGKRGSHTAATAALALAFTVMALLPAVRRQYAEQELRSLQAWMQVLRAPAARRVSRGGAEAGFQGVMLYPPPRKKEPVAPVRLLPAGALEKRRMVILFDGFYWYSKAAGEVPGAKAHVAHGTPVSVRVASADREPLFMEAHQRLAEPVELGGCSGLAIAVESRASEPVALGVVLRDGASPGRPRELLGQQVLKGTPGEQTALFAIPARGGLRRFDEITVVFGSEREGAREGARVSLESFELLAR